MLYKKIFLFALGIISILIGFFYNENSSGGAIHDSNYLLPFIQAFGNDLNEGFKLFWSNSGSLVHSPIFYIFSGKILSIFGNLNHVKISYIFLSSLLPFIFYNILKLRIRDDIYIFLFSLIIFTSPYFRSSAIWLLGDNLSLIFFSLSVLFYLKAEKTNFVIHCYLAIFFLALCCYVRYYYFPFYFFYIYVFLGKFNFKEIIKVIIFSFLIAIPAIIYFIYIIKYQNFFIFINLETGHSLQNYSTNFLVVLTIILFYLIPFLPIFYKDIIKYYLTEKKRLLIFFSTFLIFYFINLFFFQKLIFFRDSSFGGGIIKKIFDLIIFNSELLIVFTALISILILDFVFREHRKDNYFLLFCLVLSMPFIYVFQKYLDPFFYFFFFGLIKSQNVNFIILNFKQHLYLYYSYFLLFFFSTLIIY